MMRNRIGLGLLLLVLAATLVAGCGGKKAMEQPAVEPSDTPPVEQPVEPPVHEPEVQPREITAPVLEDVFFDFDKYNLTPEARATLEKNAAELRRRADVMITIEGHCDERGTKAYNLALGEKRAKAARDYLVSLGIDASRIAIVSYGEERPFDPGHDETAWARNRRAHFVVR